MPEPETHSKALFYGGTMKTFSKCDSKALKKIFEHANENICDCGIKNSEDSTFVFQKENAICTFNLLDKNGFKNPLLNSCYYLSITLCGVTADGKSYIRPFDQAAAEKIIKAFFPQTNLVWEHSPYTTQGIAAYTHHFYQFVSLAYGKTPVLLQPKDMKELIENKYFLYGGGK